MAPITRRALSAAAAAAGLALAATGIATAAASPRPVVSGTEHFQFLQTSATSNKESVIVYGVITGHGTDLQGSKVDTLKFANGSFQVAHGPGTGPQTFDPRTCLVQIDQHGTYTIGHGTGAYKGITGSGKYQLSVIAIGAQTGGRCSQTKPPVAFELIVRAVGPVRR